MTRQHDALLREDGHDIPYEDKKPGYVGTVDKVLSPLARTDDFIVHVSVVPREQNSCSF